MEPELAYFPIHNRPDIFFSTNHCFPCERPENSEKRAILLHHALKCITDFSTFITRSCAGLQRNCEQLKDSEDINTLTEIFAVTQGIQHLKAWDDRFNAAVTRALDLHKKLVEANKEENPTDENCKMLFADLVCLKQTCKQLENDIGRSLDHQKACHKIVVLMIDPQKEMPQIDMSKGKSNTWVEGSLHNLGMTVAQLHVISINVFLGCIKGLEAKSK